jgi:hypothetical protein
MVVPSFLCFERVCWRAGREGAFSRSHPHWIVMRFRSCGEQEWEQNKQEDEDVI